MRQYFCLASHFIGVFLPPKKKTTTTKQTQTTEPNKMKEGGRNNGEILV